MPVSFALVPARRQHQNLWPGAPPMCFCVSLLGERSGWTPIRSNPRGDGCICSLSKMVVVPSRAILMWLDRKTKLVGLRHICTLGRNMYLSCMVPLLRNCQGLYLHIFL